MAGQYTRLPTDERLDSLRTEFDMGETELKSVVSPDEYRSSEKNTSDFTQNINARIRNPLKDLTKEELQSDVTKFCETYGFQEEEEVFQKGALVAQQPDQFEEMPELSVKDKYHLRRETTHRWHLPRKLYICIAIVSLADIINGWDGMHHRTSHNL